MDIPWSIGTFSFLHDINELLNVTNVIEMKLKESNFFAWEFYEYNMSKLKSVKTESLIYISNIFY